MAGLLIQKVKLFWEMKVDNSANGGFLLKNRLNIEVIFLKKGKYILHYTTNNKYAYDDWNYLSNGVVTPTIPEWWGIQVFKAEEQDKQRIKTIEKNYRNQDGLYSHYTDLFKDSNGDIWVYGQSLQKLKIDSDGNFNFENVIKWSPRNKNQPWSHIHKIIEKDANTFWISARKIDRIGNQRHVVGYFNKTTKEFTEIKTGLPERYFFKTMLQDSIGNLWLGDGGFYNFRGLKKLLPPFIPFQSSEPPNLIEF